MWWWWIAASMAGEDPRLLVERGRVALESGRADAALAMATEAWEASPTWEAHRLYLDALADAGLTLWTEEVAEAEVEDPAWRTAPRVLVELARADDKAAATQADLLAARWPDRPDAFLPLWELADPGARVARFRRRLLAAAAAPIPGETTVLALYGARALLRGLGEDDAAVVEALRAAGEDLPAVPPPSTRHERSELARAMALEPFSALPSVHPSDLTDVVSRASANWAQGGDHDSAVRAWVAFRASSGDPRGAVGHAQALVAAGRLPEALEVTDQALLVVGGPWPDDVGALRFEARRELLADTFLIRARARADRDPAHALSDLTVADHLGRRVMDGALGEALHDRANPLADGVRQRYRSRGTPLQAAMRRAEVALADGDAEASSTALDDAWFLAATANPRPTPQAATAMMAELVWIQRARARALTALGRADEAVAAAAVGHHLAQGSDTALWELRARQLEASSAPAAAFNHWAVVARNADTDALEQEAAAGLARSWPGVGSHTATAIRIGLDAVPPAPPYRLDLAVETVERGVIKAVGDQEAGARPEVGAPMPGWSVTSGSAGTVSRDGMLGRVVVLVFFGGDCADCLGLLHDVGNVARSLRRENRDVVVVAVSWDEDPGEFEDARRVADNWGMLFRDPDLAERFGVTNSPTAWVVDAQGTTRVHFDRWVSLAHVERQLRRVFAE